MMDDLMIMNNNQRYVVSVDTMCDNFILNVYKVNEFGYLEYVLKNDRHNAYEEIYYVVNENFKNK